MRIYNLKTFTLVELLTVIAIIAILASILLPVITKVKEHAQAIRCMGQVRQTGLSVSNYALDNQNFRPAVYNASPTIYWAKTLINGEYIFEKYTNSILQCPQALPLALDSSYNKTYGMMRDAPYRGLDEVLSSITPYRMDSSKCPSADILLADSLKVYPEPSGNQVYTIYKNYNSSGTFQIQTRHLNNANMFFYDGHVGGLNLTKIKSLKSYNVPNPSAVGNTDYAVIGSNAQVIRWPASN